MKTIIYSRKEIEKLLHEGFLDNVAVISFCDPKTSRTNKEYNPVDYSDKTNRVFQVAIHDIDIEILGDYGLTYDCLLYTSLVPPTFHSGFNRVKLAS